MNIVTKFLVLILVGKPAYLSALHPKQMTDGDYAYFSDDRRVICREVLQAPVNGSISVPDKAVLEAGDVANFSCDRGFIMEGSSRSECTENEEWSNRSPICRIKYCPRPNELLNIPLTLPPTFDEEQRPYNSVITIPCINWHELESGATEWYCDDDETWHPRKPVRNVNENNNYPECRLLCGVKNIKPEENFVRRNVKSAWDGEWPWAALIAYPADEDFSGLEDRSLRCGGSLVGKQYVVTAAQCMRRPKDDYRVFLGVTDRFSSNNSTFQKFKVSEIFLHPEFFKNSISLYENDIAIVKLERPVVIGQYVRPICIPRTMHEINLQEQSPKKGVLIGWGKNDSNVVPQVLKVIRLPFVNEPYCKKIYEERSGNHSAFNQVKLTHNHFCAGLLPHVKDPCVGDGGGPIMWRSGSKWYLNGIVSYGTPLEGCAYNGIGFFTKVTSYLSFLDNKIMSYN